MQTNCHNCGAVITGPTCEYCGTRFEFEPVKEPENLEFKVGISASEAQLAFYEFMLGTITPNEARRRISYDS